MPRQASDEANISGIGALGSVRAQTRYAESELTANLECTT